MTMASTLERVMTARPATSRLRRRLRFGWCLVRHASSVASANIPTMRRFSHRDEDGAPARDLVRDADAAARKGDAHAGDFRFLESAVAWATRFRRDELADLQLEVDDADGAIKTASRAAQGNPTNLQRLHVERILGKKAAPPFSAAAAAAALVRVVPPPPPPIRRGWEEAFTPSSSAYLRTGRRIRRRGSGRTRIRSARTWTAFSRGDGGAGAGTDGGGGRRTGLPRRPTRPSRPSTAARNAACADAIFGSTPTAGAGRGPLRRPSTSCATPRSRWTTSPPKAMRCRTRSTDLRRLEGIAPTLAAAVSEIGGAASSSWRRRCARRMRASKT